MPRTRLILLMFIFAMGLIGAVTGGAYWWRTGRFLESTDNAYVTGDITAFSPKVSGYVEKVLVNDNQFVRKGDVLVVIEDREYQAKVARAEATVTKKRAGLENIEYRRLLQISLIEEAEASTSAHKADLVKTSKDLDRAKQLVTEGWVSKQGEDYATADEHRARAVLTSARAATTAARQKLAVLNSEKIQLLAGIAQSEAELRLAQIELDATVIRAPTSGVVGNRRVRVGEYVRPGTKLLALVPLDSVWVIANFKETQLTDMRPGQPTTINVDTFPENPVEGVVDSFSPASGAQFSLLPPENATGNFTKVVQRIPVKITLAPNNLLSGRIVPGMSVVVSVSTKPESDGVSAQNVPRYSGESSIATLKQAR